MIDPTQLKLGSVTNERFFTEFEGDYNKLLDYKIEQKKLNTKDVKKESNTSSYKQDNSAWGKFVKFIKSFDDGTRAD